MPIIVAYFVLFSWPVVVIVLFKTLDRPRAIAASIIVGYLLLPSLPQIDLPVLPILDKTLISCAEHDDHVSCFTPQETGLGCRSL